MSPKQSSVMNLSSIEGEAASERVAQPEDAECFRDEW